MEQDKMEKGFMNKEFMNRIHEPMKDIKKMERYVIERRKQGEYKWKPIKVFLKRELAEKYMKTHNKQEYRIFGE